jgi:hypothetical protein
LIGKKARTCLQKYLIESFAGLLRAAHGIPDCGSQWPNVATLLDFENSYFVSHWFGYSNDVSHKLYRKTTEFRRQTMILPVLNKQSER